MNPGRRKYRIQAVAEMTGVSAATLRAWERRYGIPAPARTEASYRLYGEDDVAVIRRLKQLIDDGMSPAEAAELLISESQHTEGPAANSDDPFRTTRNAIREAVERFDPEQLDSATQHAMALGSASVVFDRVIAPAMVEIGDLWHEGTLSVAQEHMATMVMENAAHKLLGLLQPAESHRRIVLACVAHDTHTLPLLGVAIHLASAGLRITVLGASTPPDAIADAVLRLEPSCVGLSMTIAPPPATITPLIEDYARACGGVPFAFGGYGAGELRSIIERCGGTVVLDNEPRKLVRTMDALCRRGRAHEGQP